MTPPEAREWAHNKSDGLMCIMLEDVAYADIIKLIDGKRGKVSSALRARIKRIIREAKLK